MSVKWLTIDTRPERLPQVVLNQFDGRAVLLYQVVRRMLMGGGRFDPAAVADECQMTPEAVIDLLWRLDEADVLAVTEADDMLRIGLL